MSINSDQQDRSTSIAYLDLLNICTPLFQKEWKSRSPSIQTILNLTKFIENTSKHSCLQNIHIYYKIYFMTKLMIFRVYLTQLIIIVFFIKY